MPLGFLCLNAREANKNTLRMTLEFHACQKHIILYGLNRWGRIKKEINESIQVLSPQAHTFTMGSVLHR